MQWSEFKEILVGIHETLQGIWGLLSSIGSFLGFIGLEAFILIFVTLILLWLLSLISPLHRQVNFFLGLVFGLWFAWKMSMSFEGIWKYLLFMLTPYLIAWVLHLVWGVIRGKKHMGKERNKGDINSYYEIDSTRKDPPRR